MIRLKYIIKHPAKSSWQFSILGIIVYTIVSACMVELGIAESMHNYLAKGTLAVIFLVLSIGHAYAIHNENDNENGGIARKTLCGIVVFLSSFLFMVMTGIIT